MARSEKRQLTTIVALRLAPEEKRSLEQVAAEMGMTVSKLLRASLQDHLMTDGGTAATSRAAKPTPLIAVLIQV